MTSPDIKPLEMVAKLAAQKAPIERFVPPRLSIAILLIWTAVSAVLFKLFMASPMRITVDHPKDSPHVEHIGLLFLFIIGVLLISVALTGTGIIVVSKVRGAKGRLQPGHWLLVIYTLENVTIWICILAPLFLDGIIPQGNDDRFYSSILTILAIFLLSWLVPKVLLFVAAFRCKGGRHWTVALCLLPVTEFGEIVFWNIFHSLFSMRSMYLALIPELACFIASGMIVFGAVVIDLFAGNRRDWLHWAGTGVFVTNIVFKIGSSTLNWF